MSIRSAVKPQSETLRSSAEFAAAHDEKLVEQQAEREAAELREQLPVARLAGVEALAALKQKIGMAETRAEVAGAQAEELARLHDEAVSRERDDGIRARHKRAQADAAGLRGEIEEAYANLRRAFDVLCREKVLDDEIRVINRLIAEHKPEGLTILPLVEDWRREPAIPATREVKEIPAAGGSAHVAVHKTTPDAREDVVRHVTISGGASAFVPSPLYDTFAVPGLKRGDRDLIVPGTRSHRWWQAY